MNMTSYTDTENPQIHFIPCDYLISLPDNSLYYIVVFTDDLYDDNRYKLATGYIELL